MMQMSASQQESHQCIDSTMFTSTSNVKQLEVENDPVAKYFATKPNFEIPSSKASPLKGNLSVDLTPEPGN